MTTEFSFAHREEGFDDHIDKSIRGYSDLIDDIINLSLYFTENNTWVVDLGCSTGKMLGRMIDKHEEYSLKPFYLGYEIETGFKSQLETLREKHPNKVQIVYDDVMKEIDCGLTPNQTSFVTSVFTMQFIERQFRRRLLRQICDDMIKGGAFVFAEKVYMENPQIQDMMTFALYDHKRKSFTEQDILNKEVKLRSMLRPDYWNDIEENLFEAGFAEVHRFWQNHAFIGGIAIK